MQLAKGALEGVTVRLVGEISELSNKPGYKAVYFTVKDKSASLPCMMWNNRFRAAGVQVAVGQLVELTGRFTLYAAKGRMNFDVFSLAPVGEGQLRLQVANLARKLSAEGLADPARKLPLPAYPLTIGLVTSPRGDAVHDVLRTLRRRFPVARVLFSGVAVEGPQAPAGIVEGMRAVVHAGAEVVLVVRGGGSYEDLMPFNDEFLARMIVKCPVPVVTGIGHEPDTSIADMVADVRASTPTAAAEAVSPARENLDALFGARRGSLDTCIRRAIERSAAQVGHIASRPVFCDPNALLAASAQGVDLYADRMARALPASLDRDRAQVDRLRERLGSALPNALTLDAAAVLGVGVLDICQFFGYRRAGGFHALACEVSDCRHCRRPARLNCRTDRVHDVSETLALVIQQRKNCDSTHNGSHGNADRRGQKADCRRQRGHCHAADGRNQTARLARHACYCRHSAGNFAQKVDKFAARCHYRADAGHDLAHCN